MGTKRTITGFGLKMIAVVSMLIDHTAAVWLVQYPAYRSLYEWMRLIGRLAFPIYCFLLVEGFFYTRSRKKYAGRLFLFALLSEVPFDMAFNHSFFDPSYNNVFFTLLIGLLTIWAADVIKRTWKRKDGAQALCVLCMMLPVCAGAFAAHAMRTDYRAAGVLAIVLIYWFRDNRIRAAGAAVAELALLSDIREAAAFLVLLPLWCYDGTRGKQIKYFFYAFYPLHLLALALLASVLGVGMRLG